jgi:hypothetical protein
MWFFYGNTTWMLPLSNEGYEQNQAMLCLQCKNAVRQKMGCAK